MENGCFIMNLNLESQRENLNKYRHYNVVFLFCNYFKRERRINEKNIKKGI